MATAAGPRTLGQSCAHLFRCCALPTHQACWLPPHQAGTPPL